MLFSTIFSWFSSFFTGVLDLIPNLPALPTSITTTINSVYDFIFDSFALVNLFIPVPLCITLLTLTLSIVLFKFVWGVLDFILRHIPVFGTH